MIGDGTRKTDVGPGEKATTIPGLPVTQNASELGQLSVDVTEDRCSSFSQAGQELLG